MLARVDTVRLRRPVVAASLGRFGFALQRVEEAPARVGLVLPRADDAVEWPEAGIDGRSVHGGPLDNGPGSFLQAVGQVSKMTQPSEKIGKASFREKMWQ